MIAFILDSCTKSCVSEVIDSLYEDIGAEVFKKSFPVILTDNGSEIASPEAIEYDKDSNERTKIFYCNPMASYQKPHIEKNHEYIRYILPKGKSFKNLTQEDVTLIMNHINSTA
jgi:IS30 family transposase